MLTNWSFVRAFPDFDGGALGVEFSELVACPFLLGLQTTCPGLGHWRFGLRPERRLSCHRERRGLTVPGMSRLPGEKPPWAAGLIVTRLTSRSPERSPVRVSRKVARAPDRDCRFVHWLDGDDGFGLLRVRRPLRQQTGSAPRHQQGQQEREDNGWTGQPDRMGHDAAPVQRQPVNRHENAPGARQLQGLAHGTSSHVHAQTHHSPRSTDYSKTSPRLAP